MCTHTHTHDDLQIIKGTIHNSLVEAGSVGILVFLNDGHYESNQLGPEVKVLNAGSLFLWGNFSLLGLEWGSGDIGQRGPWVGASVSSLLRGRSLVRKQCH